jgi:hypothetical protein
MSQSRFGQSRTQVRQSAPSTRSALSAVATMSGRRESFATSGSGPSLDRHEFTILKHAACFCSLSQRTQNSSPTPGFSGVVTSAYATEAPRSNRPRGEFRNSRAKRKRFTMRHGYRLRLAQHTQAPDPPEAC